MAAVLQLLCLQHSHAGTMCLRNGNHMFQQSAANAAAAKRFHHQKVCDAKAVVPAFRAALHETLPIHCPQKRHISGGLPATG